MIVTMGPRNRVRILANTAAAVLVLLGLTNLACGIDVTLKPTVGPTATGSLHVDASPAEALLKSPAAPASGSVHVDGNPTGASLKGPTAAVNGSLHLDANRTGGLKSQAAPVSGSVHVDGNPTGVSLQGPAGPVSGSLHVDGNYTGVSVEGQHGTVNGSGNGTHAAHQMTEGGFLTGRNPFQFHPSVPLPTFIIQLLVIVGMSRVVKFILTPIKQPSVIAEIISGILLGPTAMGHIPHFTEFVFPAPSLPFLNLMSNFGLVLFLFLVGLELDPQMLRKSIKKSFAISLAGMALPFFLGCGSSYVLYSYVEPAEHQKSFLSYLLFLGVAMAITAFPVLARILTELNLLKTKVGGITISAAAVDDATSWCLLALVISIINANSNLTALYVFLMGAGYSLLLILIVRPIFIKCLRMAGTFDQETPSQASIFAALAIVFISAFITDAIGIHAIFGGFIAGIIMPHEGGFAYHITEKIEDIVQILFLPLYFALSGLKTKIGTLTDILSWGVVCLVIFAACFGKIFGCTVAARMTRLNWRESFTVGALMNCKGLVELIVLNLGYDSGVISDKTFAIMVIMALVTTFITVPLVSYIYPPQYHDRPDSEKSLKKKEPSLLVSVTKLEQAGPILSAVNLLQHKLNREKMDRKGSGLSTGSGGTLKSKGSFTSLAELIHMFPGGKPSSGKGANSGVVINVLRLIELTERDSSVMLSASAGALTDDPITKLLKTFCEVSNKNNIVQGLVQVVTMEKFGSVLARSAQEENARYILVPWYGCGSMVEEKLPRRASFFEATARRMSIHTSTQHYNFFQDLLLEAKCNITIFVDRVGVETRAAMKGKDVADTTMKTIYLPFFGGKDDREALDIVMGLGHLPNLQINVIRYKQGDEDRRQSLNSNASTIDADEVRDTMGLPVTHLQVQLDNADEEIIQHYFGGKDRSQTQIVGDTNVQYSEVESPHPISQAVQYMGRLRSNDLILLGRTNVNMGDTLGLLNKGEDTERRKVLGDMAEAAILSDCEASMLIIHGYQAVNTLT